MHRCQACVVVFPSSSMVQPQPDTLIGSCGDRVVAYTAGISEAVPRTTPRTAAKVRSLVLIVVFQFMWHGLWDAFVAAGFIGFHPRPAT
jgi:hypothetical protein